MGKKDKKKGGKGGRRGHYLAPGVYIEEVPSGTKPIEGVGTAVAGFVGLTPFSPRRLALALGLAAAVVLVVRQVR